MREKVPKSILPLLSGYLPCRVDLSPAEWILPLPLFCRRIPSIEELKTHSCPNATPHLSGRVFSFRLPQTTPRNTDFFYSFPPLSFSLLVPSPACPTQTPNEKKAFAMVSLKRTLAISISCQYLPLVGYSFPLPSLGCLDLIENVAFSLEEESDCC